MAELDTRCAKWFSLHPSGGQGGTLSWEEIAAREGDPELDGEKIRHKVKRYKRAMRNGEAVSSTEEPPSSMPVSSLEVEVLDPLVLPEDWVDRLYENAKEQARIRREAYKPQNVFHIKINTELPILHVWTADWHLLDAGTDHDLFDEDVEIWRTTPGIRLGIGGDLANWFSPAVLPRAMPANTLPSDLTKPIVKKKMAEVRDQTDYVVDGNHDEFPAATGWHPVKEICRELGLPNLGPGGRVMYIVGQVTYQIEARHSFNFNSVLNDTNSHRQLWSQTGKPDMVFTAHLHHPTMHHRTFDGEDTVWARNGSYKREDHYAKSKNFVHTQSEPPDQPGVILYPNERKLIPFRNYRDALPLLKALRGGK